MKSLIKIMPNTAFHHKKSTSDKDCKLYNIDQLLSILIKSDQKAAIQVLLNLNFDIWLVIDSTTTLAQYAVDNQLMFNDKPILSFLITNSNLSNQDKINWIFYCINKNLVPEHMRQLIVDTAILNSNSNILLNTFEGYRLVQYAIDNELTINDQSAIFLL